MHAGEGAALALGWAVPFGLMLVAIALLPLVTPHWWESHLHKLWISLLLGTPVLALYLSRSPASLLHTSGEYLAFVILLAALFVVSGGILLDGDLRATPMTNTAFLAVGSLLASLVGTTGASMLLIRPVLGTNAERRHRSHTVVFFIFVVSNIGGCLTPLGDPPLFMGYLRGVPFTWTLRLWPQWLATNLLVLLVYFAWDSLAFAREPSAAILRDRLNIRPLRMVGGFNWPLAAGVLAAVALLGSPWREGFLIGLSLLSLKLTPQEIRRANHFTWRPLIEVAILFFGIFLTMLPALDLLRARGRELGIDRPWQFFWATGLLSSVLDNTPTYVTFFALAEGLELPGDLPGVRMPEPILAAISLGAVFMGANTYIGNAPNFMVRAIAEERGVRMPSFFGYALRAGLVLLPIFGLMTILFFAG